MRIDAIVKLLSSLSHIGDVVGIDAEFHREKIVLPDGRVERIPTVTGNSVRGILRDHVSLYMLEKLSLAALPLDKFYMLFSGGSLTKTGSKAISLSNARRFRQLFPILGIFGAAVGNHIMPGKISVGKVLPLAFETAHLVPSGITIPNLSVYDYMQTESYTRRDDAKNENLLKHIAVEDVSDQQALFEAKKDNDYTADETGTAQQMRYNVETISAGTLMYWYLAYKDLTAIELLALVSGLRHWSEYPVLGGKGAIGHGLVQIEFDNGWFISPERVELPDMREYDEYLAANRDEIVGVLNEA